MVVECEESLELSSLTPTEWRMFAREVWLAIVARYKDGIYGDESGPAEWKQGRAEEMDVELMDEEEGLEFIPPWTLPEKTELEGIWPEGRWSEPVDMRHFKEEEGFLNSIVSMALNCS
jgi:hypothetical protein